MNLYTALLILFSSIATNALKSIAFQGTCADEAVLCEQLCIALSTETYECGCWDGHILLPDGVSCITNGSEIEVEYSKKKRLSAQKSSSQSEVLCFEGDSFAKFPAPDNAYLETNITLEFRTNGSQKGIMLYAGEFDGNDFISLAIDDNSIVLRFDCGEGTVEDLYGGPFEKDVWVWHTLVVKRKYCSRSEIKVDDESLMADDIKELRNFKGITIDDGIFLGGAPANVSRLAERTGASTGFRGCIRRLIVNDVTLFDSKNNVNKIISRQEQSSIHNDSLQEGARILTANDNTKEKLNANSTWPPQSVRNVEFDGDSYVKHHAPQDIDVYLELSFHLKPKEPSGLIYLHHSKTHYFAVFLEDAYLNAQFSMGADHVILRSERPLAMNVWQRAEIWRSGRAALIKVGNQPWIENRVTNSIPDFDKTEFSYFGGAPEDAIPSEIGDLEGFVGCLKKVHQNTRAVHLLENVVDAHDTHICGWDPCSEVRCQGDARCVDERSSAICLCRFPLFGETCQNSHNTAPASMKFSRFSYLRFTDHRIMKHVTGELLDISMLVKLNEKTRASNTHNLNKILAYTGESENVGDFLRLFVTTRNEVQLVINLGSGSAALSHPTLLDTGVWYNVTASRNKQQVSLAINGSSVTTATPGSSIEMNVYDSLFIGGAQNMEKTFEGFDGCIRDVRIGFEYIDSPANASEAVNIVECSA